MNNLNTNNNKINQKKVKKDKEMKILDVAN